MKHIMCDLETFDTKPSALVVSIGAVRFDPALGTIGEKFYRVLDLQTQSDRGRTTSESTKNWWAQQSDDARAVLSAPKTDSLVALADFYDFVAGEGCDGFWGNGATFDNVIMDSLYDTFGLKPPWPFWAHRCYRTIKALYVNAHPKGYLPPFKGTKHNALADAEHQAECLLVMAQNMKLVL